MSLGYAYVEYALRHTCLHYVHGAPGRHGWGYAHYGRIHLGQLQQCLAEYLLKFFADCLYAFAFAGVGVENSGGVPCGLALFGRGVSFAFDGEGVQQLGALYVFHVLQYTH